MVKYKIIPYDRSHTDEILTFGMNDKLLENDASSEEEVENSIQKFQTKTAAEVTCMIPKNPEVDVVVNTTKTAKEVPKVDSSKTPGISKPFVLAPGEGIVPTDIMREENWKGRRRF